MSDTSTPATVTATFAQQTQTASGPPPLLPAFLITGLLLAAIVSIIVWRHVIERRHVHRREDDPTWPIDLILDRDGGGPPKGPIPMIWDLEVMNKSGWAAWEDIMASHTQWTIARR